MCMKHLQRIADACEPDRKGDEAGKVRIAELEATIERMGVELCTASEANMNLWNVYDTEMRAFTRIKNELTDRIAELETVINHRNKSLNRCLDTIQRMKDADG